MRRFACVYLPTLPTDLWRRRRPEAAGPLALVQSGPGGGRLAAVDAAAAACGLTPGRLLADARALVPHLRVADHDPAAVAAALAGLARWCTRYTPWAAADGADGLVLDITGAAHLFGGEGALLVDLRRRLGRAGLAARAAAAGTAAAAWALARYGAADAVAASGAEGAALADLPVAALRIDGPTVFRLQRFGLVRIGQVAALPRGPLTDRLGPALLRRLDQALGQTAESIGPGQPMPAWRTLRRFGEPIGRPEDVAAACEQLLAALLAMLAQDGRGIRRLRLRCYGVDGGVQEAEVGTAAPTRAGDHLRRLLAPRLAAIDCGFGIEAVALEALRTDPLNAQQPALQPDAAQDRTAYHELLDRLQARLGPAQVRRVRPTGSHVPEQAAAFVPAASGPRFPWDRRLPPRPLLLLDPAEPVEAVALLPEGLPAQFRWRRAPHRVVRAEGPERIGSEWWRGPSALAFRDYWRVEDEAGRRFWLYRSDRRDRPSAGQWFLHGLAP